MENNPPSGYDQDTLDVIDVNGVDTQAITDETSGGPIFTEEEADRLGIVLDEHGRHIPEDSDKTKEWFDKKW